MFKEKMYTEAIPERVFALCKVVEEHNSIKIKDAQEMMEPKFLTGSQNRYFNYYKMAAEELGLIVDVDNMLTLGVCPSVIESMHTMRHFINGQLNRFCDGLFYQVTKSFYDLNDIVLHRIKSVAELDDLISIPLVDDKGMRAWRFWASYLGFGNLQGKDGMFFLPNAYTYLKDIIIKVGYEIGSRYTVQEFFDAMKPYSDIIYNEDTGKTINYGVSNGFRTLEKLGYIKMEYVMDQSEVWHLYPIPELTGSEVFSNVIILKR